MNDRVQQGHRWLLALMVAVLVGLAGLSGGWLATELAAAGPQPVASACQSGGGGC